MVRLFFVTLLFVGSKRILLTHVFNVIYSLSTTHCYGLKHTKIKINLVLYGYALLTLLTSKI